MFLRNVRKGSEEHGSNILDDNVLHTIRHAETFASDDPFWANADDGFVGFNFDRANTSLIICDLNRLHACSSITICAPATISLELLSTLQ